MVQGVQKSLSDHNTLRRDPDWDPSYGFLSPQLGTRSTALQRRWNGGGGAPDAPPVTTRNAV